MLIFYADTRGLDEGRALCRGRSRAPGSAFAYSLLRYALEVWKGAPELPEITTDGRGKPYFPERPDWHFSLSHTRGFVLAAVSAAPVGADVQLRDGRGERLAGRLMSEREREQFDFYELWSLRESLYKLTGEGSLRSLRFERRGGLIVPPRGRALPRLRRHPRLLRRRGQPGRAAPGAPYPRRRGENLLLKYMGPCYIIVPTPVWRNWQTHRTQNAAERSMPVRVRPPAP